MFALIRDNLTRQARGLELLESLLHEEFEHLKKRDTDSIGSLEFSMHELLRQLADERTDLKKSMHGTKIKEYAGLLPEEDGAEVLRLFECIDTAEQRCARQASLNTELSLALLDQSHNLMAFLHDQIAPKPQLVYGAKGRFAAPRPTAALINGRL